MLPFGWRIPPTLRRFGGGLHLMRELVAACEEAHYDAMGDGYVYGFPGEKSERLAGRYGFDHEPGLPGDASHDGLLREIFVASLEDIRDSLEGEVAPDLRLGQLFSAHLAAKVVGEPSVIEVLTEIRDLLRERLPERSRVVPSVTTKCAECGEPVVAVSPTLGQVRDPNSQEVPQVRLPSTQGDERLAGADEKGRFTCPHCGASNMEPQLELV